MCWLCPIILPPNLTWSTQLQITAKALRAEADKVELERVYSHGLYMLGSFSFFFVA